MPLERESGIASESQSIFYARTFLQDDSQVKEIKIAAFDLVFLELLTQ